jgi:hypothetical protein
MVSEVERLNKEVETLKAKMGEVEAMKARLEALERAMGLPEWRPSKKERNIIENRIDSNEDCVPLEAIEAKLQDQSKR